MKRTILFVILLCIATPVYATTEYPYPVQEDYLPIIGYHKVIPDNEVLDAIGTEIYLSDFKRQIEYLNNTLKCRWLTFSKAMEYVNNRTKLPTNACVLTFDDGTHYEYENVLPILDKYNAVASFYIIAGKAGIGGCSGCPLGYYYMDWSELDELYFKGHEIGSHSVNVSKGLNRENHSYSSIVYQINESKNILENHGFIVSTFAYPLGQWDKTIIDIINNSDYIGGRDTSKDKIWKDKRPIAIWDNNVNLTYDGTSYNNNSAENNVGKWHMFYYKPEQKTLEQLGKEIQYTGWWQFEDQYTIDSDKNNIRVLSSLNITDTTYEVLDLQDANDKISSMFILPDKDEYLIEIFAETGSISNYEYLSNIAVFIDDKPVSIDRGNSHDCVEFNSRYYCPIEIEKKLKKGVHKLSIRAKDKGLRVDKFRIFSKHDHSFYVTSQYNINIENMYISDKLLRWAGIHDYKNIKEYSNLTYKSPLNSLSNTTKIAGNDNSFNNSTINSVDKTSVDSEAETSFLRKLLNKTTVSFGSDSNIDIPEVPTPEKLSNSETYGDPLLEEKNCQNGYVKINFAKGYVCNDINECLDHNTCEQNQLCINIKGGYVCRTKQNKSIYLIIYDHYPKSNNGKEVLYDFFNEGDIDTANKLMEDIYTIPRYEPVKLRSPLSWRENPYDEKYWRYIHYSLRETRHLLYAYEMTGDERYINKLKENINSFIDTGMNADDISDIIDKPLESCETKRCMYVWEYHTTAYRTLVLINTWWKLREENVLDYELNEKMLKAMSIHGDFLMEDYHYEGEHNHGIIEASALYILATNFPNLPNADKWYNTSETRIKSGLNTLIDEDGILVENSPYYHFYVMKIYWNLHKYLEKQKNYELKDCIEYKLNKMISYGTYVLQPNIETPLIGASLRNEVRLKGEFFEIADTNSEFLYILTRGVNGTQPEKLNIYYPIAGQTIIRSGWGKGEDFKHQTQLIFDIGPYRTTHSDLDALSFQLFGKSIALLPDAGLYTYEKNKYRNYFHGTSSHNTIVVDGKDQKKGKAYAGLFYENGPVVYQSGQHALYDGVVHQRGILMLNKKYILIIDNLLADKIHNYDLIFHFYPDMNVSLHNMTVLGNYENEETVSLHPLIQEDLKTHTFLAEESPVKGWCSWEYEKAIPCYSVSYSKIDRSTSFMTLIEIGKPDENLSADLITFSGKEIIVNLATKENNYNINISNFLSEDEKIKVEQW